MSCLFSHSVNPTSGMTNPGNLLATSAVNLPQATSPAFTHWKLVQDCNGKLSYQYSPMTRHLVKESLYYVVLASLIKPAPAPPILPLLAFTLSTVYWR